MATLAPAAEGDSNSVPANAREGVKYIGSEKCAECHNSQSSSFHRTAHSKAAQITGQGEEPEPNSFDHAASGNRYEVAIDDGVMLHREILRDADGKELSVTEHPMSVTLGSGTHAKSYLTRDGPFHIESPITYFSDDHKWSMSPGYDEPVHRSFRRTVTVSCVFCHVGSISQERRNPYKFEILEGQIGCERCHGPGELHEEWHRNGDATATGTDPIVNPQSLSRELAEAICQQCHCQGVQAINLPGKTDWDFRPGLPLTDFRVDFQFRRGDNSMRLVGHVEQMHQSKCYTETTSLTCVTCHDPHDPPPSNDPTAYFRDKCYICHDDSACGKPNTERMTFNGNNCTECHMPAGDTNVSHFALHDHRIGLHQETKVDRTVDDAVNFASILPIDHLPGIQQRRLNALAKYEIHRRHGANPKFANFNIEAIGELIQVKQAGEADADVDAALVWLARDQGETEIAESVAKEILADEVDETMARIVATNVLAQIAFSRNDFQKAYSLYRTLDHYHRDGRDTYFLGLSAQNTKNTEQAIEALKRSIAIEPSQVAAHAALQAIYLSTGRTIEAEVHAKAAKENQILQQRYAREEKRMRERAAREASQ